MKSIAVYLMTIALLAFFAGGAIFVLFVLLPFWQSLEPEALMDWFRNFGSRLGIIMMPMEILPLILSVCAWFIAKKNKNAGRNLWAWVNVLNIIILSMFFVYFLPVNLEFINKTADPAGVPAEMIKWKMIHGIRTLFTILSTVLAVLAFSKYLKSKTNNDDLHNKK